MNKKLKVAVNFIHNVGYLDERIYIKENMKERRKGGRGNLFCLWVFWVNRCSTFSYNSYFVLDSR